MKTIRFLETVVDQRYGLTYESGSVRSMQDGSAFHWIKRGKAEEVKGVVDEQINTEEPVLDDDGDELDSTTDVEGQDGGDTSERPVHVTRGRRGRQKKPT